MEKHKFALTVQNRVISLKFSTHRVSKKCTLGNFQKFFLFPKMAAILNFQIFAKNRKTGICFYLLNRARCILDRQMASASFPDMCITVPEDGRLPFVMSFIFNPNCFFIHLISLDSAKTVDKLMNELNAYYSSESTNSLLLKKFISEGVPTPGDIVCACFSEDSRYYRAQVLNVKTVTIEGKEFTRVQVFYVDFGNKEWLPREQIYPLPPRFAEHPPQAVCCTLTGVRQVKMKETNTSADQGEDEGWDVELTREFVKLTGFDKELYGFVVGAREGEVLR